MSGMSNSIREQPPVSATKGKPVHQEDPAQPQIKRKRNGRSRCKIFYLSLSIYLDVQLIYNFLLELQGYSIIIQQFCKLYSIIDYYKILSIFPVLSSRIFLLIYFMYSSLQLLPHTPKLVALPLLFSKHNFIVYICQSVLYIDSVVLFFQIPCITDIVFFSV